jgi:chitinase
MKNAYRLIALAAAMAAAMAAGSAQAYDCSAVPAWTAADIYTGGKLAQQNNKAYQAKWWTQNNSPATNSGTWDVWKPLGDCEGNPPVDTTPPSVPAGLRVANKTTQASVHR